jgi:hypothetical protein
VLLALALAGCSTLPPPPPVSASISAQDHAHDHDVRAPLPPGTSLAVACRVGAFVESSSIINSVIEIAAALPPDTPERTQNELNSVLYTALKQAQSEVHCIQGGLSYGYQEAYAAIIERGAQLAQLRGLSPDIAAIGFEVAAILRANKAAPARSN